MKGLPRYGNRLEQSEIHEMLRNDRRRATIEVLRNKVGSVSLSTLAETIAEREVEGASPSRDLRRSVYNSLHQTHLPKLDDRDIIDYDPDRKTIRLDDEVRDVYVHMEVVSEYGITWADFYRMLGVLALLTVVASELGVPAISGLDPLLISTGYLLVFGGAIGRQLWTNRWIYLQPYLPSE